jgi:hypothetical protein
VSNSKNEAQVFADLARPGLTDQERARLLGLCKARTLGAVATEARISRLTVASLCSGLPARAGSEIAARVYLAQHED